MPSEKYNKNSAPEIAWNGERLGLVTRCTRFYLGNNEYFSYYGIQLCGFALEIYDKNGLQYEGIYESSLDALTVPDNYNGTCRLTDVDGLLLHW